MKKHPATVTLKVPVFKAMRGNVTVTMYIDLADMDVDIGRWRVHLTMLEAKALHELLNEALEKPPHP